MKVLNLAFPALEGCLLHAYLKVSIRILYSQPLSLVLARATSYRPICIQVVFVLGTYKKTDANLDL